MKIRKGKRAVRRGLSILLVWTMIFSSVEGTVFATESAAGQTEMSGTDVPSESMQPDTADAPSEEQPDGTDAPSGTEHPDEIETPSEPEQPGEAETPSEPEHPDETETPSESEHPDETETPSELEQPDDAGITVEPEDSEGAKDNDSVTEDNEEVLSDSISKNDLMKAEVQTDQTALASSEYIQDQGKVNQITWKIISTGTDVKLIIEGTGDYIDKGNPPWVEKYKDEITSAEVNVKGITSTKNMFYNLWRLRTVDLTGLDTGKVTDMTGMFAVCNTLEINSKGEHEAFSNLGSLDLSNFDTSHVTSMANMFRGCKKLTSLDLSNFDTSNVKDMSYMFDYCYGLKSLDLSNFDTGSVTNMKCMFRAVGDKDFTMNFGKSFHTGNVANMVGMFEECWNWKEIDVSGLDTSGATDMERMFNECRQIERLDLSGFRTDNVMNMRNMFSGCTGLKELNVSGFQTGRVKNMNNMFLDCVNLTALDLSGFDTGNVTNMTSMFSGCTGLVSLNIDGFDTGSVTGMKEMFLNCQSLTELNVSSFNTAKVNSMENMFMNCSALTALDAGAFDTAGVRSMTGMFAGGSSLTSLSVSGFDTGQVSDMHNMFLNCSSLDSLDVSRFDTVEVTSMAGMFAGCRNLNALDLSSFDLVNLELDELLGINGGEGLLSDCYGLTSVYTPRNCNVTIALPDSGADQWYRRDGREYTSLPMGLSHSIVLYKNNYPDDGAESSTVLISGITVKNKIYDGEPYQYDGTPSAVDEMGNEIEGAVFVSSYSGTATDGSTYESDSQAPLQAGNYVLTLEVSDADGKKYGTVSYHFMISRRTVAITAPTIAIDLNKAVPDLSGYECGIDGFLEGDSLSEQPQLKYAVAADRILTSQAGSYGIIPYGAAVAGQTAGNYRLQYVEGSLNIGQTTEESEVLAEGTINKITWKLTKAGKLTIAGSGDYAKLAYYEIAKTPWTTDAIKDKITFAEVKVSGMTNMNSMFYSCKNLKGVNLSGTDVSKVVDMSFMFSGCSSLENLDLSKFRTEDLVLTDEMFANCGSLKSLKLGQIYFDTTRGNYPSASSMFQNCSSLESIDLSGFHTYKQLDIRGMFEGCRSLKSLDLSSFTRSEYVLDRMFKNCSALESVNLSHFDAAGVRYMNEMFSGCSSLKSVDLSSFHAVDVVGMTAMFYNCSSLEQVDLSGLKLYDPESPVDRDGMNRMFAGCSSLEQLDLSGFNTSQITDMREMFAGCSALRKLNLDGFDTSSVTDMSDMFADCASLVNLDLWSFDTSQVVNMSNMFTGCANLNDVNLDSFDTGQVTEMGSMFYGCISLTGLDLSGFDMSGTTSAGNMFYNCKALSYLFAPQNCNSTVQLPVLADTDRWTSQNGTVYTELPKGQAGSILIYKNGYLESSTGEIKQIVSLSGIEIRSKVYDGNPVFCIGNAVVTDAYEEIVPDFIVEYNYAGKLANNTSYAPTLQAPSQAGDYSLSVNAAGELADRYVIRGNLFHFQISQRAVTISVPAVVIETGSPLPAVTDLKYTADGLLEGETLLVQPSFRYDPVPDTTEHPGTYRIIPYGADAGNNYRMQYVNGVLLVGDTGEVLPEDIPADGLIPDGLWIAGISETGYDYTGKAIKPEVRVYDHKTLLQFKTDYTIAYARNIKAYPYVSGDSAFHAKNAPTVTVTGKGNYSGKETQTFRILPLDIGSSDDTFAADDMAVAYSRKAQKPLPILWWNDKKLKNKTDYTITYRQDGKTLASVEETGVYQIELTGKGNYTGKRVISLTVTDSLKPVSKTSITKIPNQPYTGEGIRPALVVKDGKTILTENEHYTVAYSRNTAVGTAYAVVTGIEQKGYSGTKRVSFKITGTPMSKVTVTGLKDRTFTYEGTDHEPELQLAVNVKVNGVMTQQPLRKDIDYTFRWQKNRNAGTATVVFTGKGGYTGTLKKTFKIGKYDIAANTGGRFKARLVQDSIPYAKGGAKPEMEVTFQNGDGSVQILTEGADYTLSYKNHTACNDGGRPDKLPSVTIKGKGNFQGVYATQLNYRITPQDLGEKGIQVAAADKAYQNKKNIYKTKVTVTDVNGKALKAGMDYDKSIVYTYQEETRLDNGTVRAAGAEVNVNDIIPAGTCLNVQVKAKEGGNYVGSITGTYRITHADISKASVSVKKQTYTGSAVLLNQDKNGNGILDEEEKDITVKLKGKPVAEDQYEIVSGSYKNNVKKGTASVTIRGINNHGGTKTVKFTIKAKGFLWWWRQ